MLVISVVIALVVIILQVRNNTYKDVHILNTTTI